MNAIPAYLHLLHALSQQGRKTRSGVATEAMLAQCRRCVHFDDRGCSRMTAREFAEFLADATALGCPEADSGPPDK